MAKQTGATVQHDNTALKNQVSGDVDELTSRLLSLDSVEEKGESDEDKPKRQADDASTDAEEADETGADSTEEAPEEQSEGSEEAAEESEEESAESDEGKEGEETEGGSEEAADAETEDAVKLEYPKFKARVDKLTAQKKALEERLAALEAKINSSGESHKVEPLPVQPSNPFSQLATEAEVRAEYARAEEVISWAEENEDGAVIKGKDGAEVEYTAEQVRAIRRNAERAIRTHLPSQQQYLRERARFDAVADKVYPWLGDRSSPEFAAAAEVLRAFPEIQRFPEFRVAIGDLVEGRKLREAKAKEKASVKPVKVAPKLAPKQKSAPAKAPRRDEKLTDAKKRLFSSGGSEAELAKFLMAH
jgi:hypothetical protein